MYNDFLGCFFATVSSGTMVVSFTLILVALLIMFFMFKKESFTFLSKIYIILSLIILGSFTFFMIIRNDAYFQEILFELFKHGLGRFLFYPETFILLASIVPFLSIVFLCFDFKSYKN